jgi:hypothetical protein
MNIKEQVKGLLKEQMYEKLSSLSASRKRTLTMLISLTYDREDIISWRAMEAIGVFTGEFADSDPETVRHTVERLLWMIRDESGGIGWSVPEILAEIVVNNPTLCSDIPPIIVSFHDEPPLRAGVLRAIGRIGTLSQEMVDDALPVVRMYLHSDDSTVRGIAAWALGKLNMPEIENELRALATDDAPVTIYEKGGLKEKTVGFIAQESLENLKGRV